jgi:hypothetical protein
MICIKCIRLTRKLKFLSEMLHYYNIYLKTHKRSFTTTNVVGKESIIVCRHNKHKTSIAVEPNKHRRADMDKTSIAVDPKKLHVEPNKLPEPKTSVDPKKLPVEPPSPAPDNATMAQAGSALDNATMAQAAESLSKHLGGAAESLSKHLGGAAESLSKHLGGAAAKASKRGKIKTLKTLESLLFYAQYIIRSTRIFVDP